MTAIRNIETGEWIHGNGRKPDLPPPPPVTFVRVHSDFADGDYRRERIIHLPSIEQIQVRGTGIWVYIHRDPEPLRLFEHEYELLIEHLEYSGAMLDLGSGLPE